MGKTALDRPVLGDPEVYPSEEVLLSHLGRAGAAFRALFEYNASRHPDSVGTWKFYKDGKSGLFNLSRKKKTLFWLSIREGSFRTTFYLGASAEAAILESGLSEELKSQYRESTGKKLRGVTLVVKTKKDLEPYRELLAIKLGCAQA